MFAGLFRQMDTKKPATAGKYKNIPYFNGGLFAQVDPIELTKEELLLIGEEEKGRCMARDWSKSTRQFLAPSSNRARTRRERHAFGAHFTHEADIQRIVGPTIVTPWLERINDAKTMKDLLALRKELLEFRVLDPAWAVVTSCTSPIAKWSGSKFAS